MKWILFFSLLLTLNVQASNFVKGEGKFISQSEDNYEFVKEQLIHEAIKSIVTKKIQDMGLNADLYWEKYNERLNNAYSSLEENLKAKYNITEKSSASQLNAYRKNLRLKKHNMRKSFGRMNKMLSKFVIKKISRSQKNPNYRMIRLEGSVDTSLLTKEYYALIRGTKQSDYGSLFIYPHFSLENITYSELGIDNENDFNGEISRNWLKWFSSNKPGNIANIELIGREKEELLNTYMKIPNDMVLSQVPEVFVNSLLIEIEAKILKVKYESKINSYEFKYGGEAFLRDLQSNLIIGSYEIPSEVKYYNLKENSNLANIVANHVYQMVRASFPQMIKNVKELTPITTINKVQLSNYKNTSAVKSFISLAEERGVKYSIKLEYESLNKDSADLLLYFDGSTEEVKSYFEQLKSAKKDLSYEVVESGNTLGIKFNEVIESL